MSLYIDEYGDAYRNGRYAPEVIVPTRAEAERDDRECGPARNHDFELPVGAEDFAVGITPDADQDRPF